MTKPTNLKNLAVLKTAEADEAIRVELLHPATDEPLGVYLYVVSSESERAQKFIAQQMRKEQMRELENSKRRKPKVKEYDEMIEEARAMALSRLVGWENVAWGAEDKALEFNEANAEMLLTECRWITAQIFEHSNDLGKFLPKA